MVINRKVFLINGVWPKPWSQSKIKQLRNPGKLHEIRKKNKVTIGWILGFALNQPFALLVYSFSSIPSLSLLALSPFNQETTLPFFFTCQNISPTSF